MKNKKYHIIGIFPKTNRKIVELGKVDTPNTKMSWGKTMIYKYNRFHQLWLTFSIKKKELTKNNSPK